MSRGSLTGFQKPVRFTELIYIISQHTLIKQLKFMDNNYSNTAVVTLLNRNSISPIIHMHELKRFYVKVYYTVLLSLLSSSVYRKYPDINYWG